MAKLSDSYWFKNKNKKIIIILLIIISNSNSNLWKEKSYKSFSHNLKCFKYFTICLSYYTFKKNLYNGFSNLRRSGLWDKSKIIESIHKRHWKVGEKTKPFKKKKKKQKKLSNILSSFPPNYDTITSSCDVTLRPQPTYFLLQGMPNKDWLYGLPSAYLQTHTHTLSSSPDVDCYWRRELRLTRWRERRDKRNHRKR